jgi:hypothetical protein
MSGDLDSNTVEFSAMCLANASASSGLSKQNTAKTASSGRRECVMQSPAYARQHQRQEPPADLSARSIQR